MKKYTKTGMSIWEEAERQKAIKKELHCQFVRINPDEKGFDMDTEIGKRFSHIKESSKKSLVGKISKKTIRIKFRRLIKRTILQFV